MEATKLTIAETLIIQSKLISELKRYIKYLQDYYNGNETYSARIEILDKIEELKSQLP